LTDNSIKQVDIIASDRQEGLPVNYKTPFSIAAGIEYEFSDATLVNLAVEWFAPLSPYVVMQPAPDDFIQNNPIDGAKLNSEVLLRVYDSMRGVLNAGIAVEQKFSDKLSGYAAFRTDFSNANYADIPGLRLGVTDLNIYHFTVGVSANFEDRSIGIGFEYSHGQRSDATQIFNFPTVSVEPGDIAILSNRGTCKALYNNFNLFFGVTQLL